MVIQTLLPFFAAIRVSGSDYQTFLHSQLSNDIHNLAPQQACYATYNTAKGRVIANMIVWHTNQQDIILIMAADLAESVIKRLKMFVLRAKVTFEQLHHWGVSGSLNKHQQPCPPSEPQLHFPSTENGIITLPHQGQIHIAPLAQLPHHQPEHEIIWQQHEIRSGYPWISAKTSETCVAQMLNQHQIGGIHFRKGCYPGQEIIARAQYRGQVKRGLAVASNPYTQQVGQPVKINEAEVGIIVNTCQQLSLLVIKYDAVSPMLTDCAGHRFTLEHLFFQAPKTTE